VSKIAPASVPLDLRAAPAGLLDPNIAPPVVAESGDPFTALRVLHLLARIPRGHPVSLPDIVDRLNATYLDWLFTLPIVTDTALQLRANWIADYRSTSGVVVEDGERGPTITIEDSSRVDPWIVRQVEREAAACHGQLRSFSRRDRQSADG
jgi:hypothetical protein